MVVVMLMMMMMMNMMMMMMMIMMIMITRESTMMIIIMLNFPIRNKADGFSIITLVPWILPSALSSSSMPKASPMS
jgi:hypothetical protein